jgi:fructose 1,6-bisphosphatase
VGNISITLSVIKADVGGYVGHSESHPDVLAKKLQKRFVDLD